MAHTRRSPPDEPDDNSDDSAHSWLLQVALEPSEQLVDTLQNNYLFSFTLRKAHLRGGLGLQLYDTHGGALCVRHVWPHGTLHSWNKLCVGTHQKVRRGDFIIQVNKVSGNVDVRREVYLWAHSPGRQCLLCRNRFRNKCPFSQGGGSCKYFHKVGNYPDHHLKTECEKVDKHGNDTYNWKEFSPQQEPEFAPTQEPEFAPQPDDSAELRWDPFYRTHFTYQLLRSAYQDQYAEEELMAYWQQLPVPFEDGQHV